MGIGQLYQTVLSNLNHSIYTLDTDPDKNADFTDIDQILSAKRVYDTIHICTPNFTHFDIAYRLANKGKIIFIEKPGVKNSEEWRYLVNKFPKTRFMMVKNNQYRDNIDHIVELANNSKTISLNWRNKDRVPNPGSWFTDIEKSYGGVSRDLMPHLLSIFIKCVPDYLKAELIKKESDQEWELKNLLSTEYGTIDPNGIYNVDDCFELHYEINDQIYKLSSAWRTLSDDDRAIHYDDQSIELGLCPESAYQNMIKHALNNIDNDEFWTEQLIQDLWIHNQIDFEK